MIKRIKYYKVYSKYSIFYVNARNKKEAILIIKKQHPLLIGENFKATSKLN